MVEVEAKFIAQSDELWEMFAKGGELAGCAVRLKRRERLRSIYLDTPQWSLLLTGIALRIRAHEGAPGCELTAKWAGAVAAGIHRRSEYTTELPRRPRLPLRELPPELVPLLVPVVAGRPLVPVLVTEVDRTTFRILSRSARSTRELAELALDWVSVGSDPRALKLQYREVELELRSGAKKDLVRLAQDLERRFGLRRHRFSKFERGLRAAYTRVPKFGVPARPRKKYEIVASALELLRARDRALRSKVSRENVASHIRSLESALLALSAREQTKVLSVVMGLQRRLAKAEGLLEFIEQGRLSASGGRLQEKLAMAAANLISKVLASRDYFDFLVRLEVLAFGDRIPLPKHDV
ncbi:MAG: CYTH domain-containing protein [Candidatus Binatia bacterium]|nr:CYTH domain-containing protein [Candidatus Binatia bacterium]